MIMTSRPTVLASAVLALALLGDSLLYAVLPLHAPSFGVSLAWVGVLLSANRIIRLFVYPFLPRIAATGLRRFTIAGAAVGALSTLAFAFSSGAWALLASRVAWGTAFGSLSLSTLSYATAWSDGAGKRVGLSLSVRELGPLFSLTAGTLCVALLGVRPVLATLGIVSLAGVFLATRLPDPAIGARPCGAAAASAAGFSREPRRPGAAAAPQDTVRPLPRANAEWLSFFSGFVTDGIFAATVGLLLASSGGAAAAAIGAGMLLGFKRVAVVVLAPLGGHAADRFGGGIVTAAGLAVSAIGAFAIACDGVIAGAVLLSCGAAVTATSLPVAAAAQNVDERVHALARLGFARDAGAAAGPLVALALFDAAGAVAIYAASGVLLAVLAVQSSAPARRS
jgi:MFS family permease